MANTRFEVVRVLEWEDKNGEPQTRIEPTIGERWYPNVETADRMVRILNDHRTGSQRSAGLSFEMRTVKES